MDVFSQNAAGAFSMMTLTALLTDQAHIPQRIGELGIFAPEGITTTKASIERQGNTLSLIPVTARNAPRTKNTKDSRDILDIPTARLAVDDDVWADEVQNVRALGSQNDLLMLQNEVNRRNLRMSNSIEATIERHRVSALKGQVLDADGSVLLDLFTTFNVSAQSEVDFDLDNASPASGALRKSCSAVIRLIEDALQNLPYSSVYCMCSSQFFDDLTAHPEFRAYHLNWQKAEELASRIARRRVEFGGITFEEYRGSVGGTAYVTDSKAHFFPIGVPDLYLTRYAPAEFAETVNTIGLPRYARIINDPRDLGAKVTAVVQCQVLNICTRPRVLIPAKRT